MIKDSGNMASAGAVGREVGGTIHNASKWIRMIEPLPEQ